MKDDKMFSHFRKIKLFSFKPKSIYIGSGSNVNHFLVVNVRTTKSATRGGWLGATLGPRRMTRRDSWEGIELKGGPRSKPHLLTNLRHVARSRLSSRSQPKSGSHLNFHLSLSLSLYIYIYMIRFKGEPLFGCEREDNREHDTWRMTRCDSWEDIELKGGPRSKPHLLTNLRQ